MMLDEKRQVHGTRIIVDARLLWSSGPSWLWPCWGTVLGSDATLQNRWSF